MKKLIALAVMSIMLISTPGFAATEIMMGTGGNDGFWHNELFSILKSSVKRFSNGELILVKEKRGTDGTIANLKGTESGKYPISIVQKCGTVLLGADVEEIGVLMYEVAHLISFDNSPIDDVGDLESGKGYNLGINKGSGSYVTWQMFQKVDKDYKKANVVDFQKTTKALNGMRNGEFDAMFFVSAPGTKAISRAIKAGVEFRDIDDSDFNDYKVNKKRLYNFTTMKKKDGYPNNFDTIFVQDVLVVNRDWIEDNDQYYDVLYDACEDAFAKIKAKKKWKFYPKK